MDERQEAFLVRLRETFRVEAAEHVGAIAQGLIDIEGAGDEDRPAIVESIFRESHSLKGAARAVSFREVERFCAELENVFAAMKKGQVVVSKALLDVAHEALDVVSTACAGGTGEAPPEDRNKVDRILATLRAVAGGSEVGAVSTEQVTPSLPASESVGAGAGDTRQALGGEQGASGPAGPSGPAAEVAAPDRVGVQGSADTVRVSAEKLGEILRDVEELVSIKIAAGELSAELASLSLELARWNDVRVGFVSRVGSGSDSGSAITVAEVLRTERLYAKALEDRLRRLSRSAQRDARGLVNTAESLLEATKRLLMLPCSHLLGLTPILVRDLARERNKEVDVSVIGGDIEIDRRVLDELKDPFLHLLRNCVDHGIEDPAARREAGKPERGVITISVTMVEGNRVEFTVGDDGAGMDVVALTKAAGRAGVLPENGAAELDDAALAALAFRSGVSTSSIITDLSGRGLGLAIVREKVEALGGSISVTTTWGVGTTFRILAPLTLATFRGVFVEAAGHRFAVPTVNVVRVVRAAPADITAVGNRDTIMVEGRAVSLVRLRDVLGLSGTDPRANGTPWPVVVVRAAEEQIAFVVDEVSGEQEVSVRGFGRQFAEVRNVNGMAVLSTGALVPVLDAANLIETARGTAPGRTEVAATPASERRRRLLIAEDSITSRALIKAILEGAGYEVVAAVDGLDVLTRLGNEAFDLVVSDVDMPRMNGFELTAEIRSDKRFEDLPIVLLTALGSAKDREYGVKVGASAYVVKSDFDQSNLIEIVGRLL